MNKNSSLAAVLVALCAVDGALAADAIDNSVIYEPTIADSALPFYASFNAGVALPGVVRVDGSVASNGLPAFTGTLNINAGAAIGVALGYHFTDRLRAEAAFGLAHNGVSGFNFQFAGGGTATGTSTGSVTTATAFGVGFFDFTRFGDFVPYLSAGLGVINLTANNIVVSANPDGTTTGNSTVFGGRVGGGFNYKLSETFSVGVDYFALMGSRSTFRFNDPVGAPALGVAPFSRSITADTMGHSLSLSLDGHF